MSSSGAAEGELSPTAEEIAHLVAAEATAGEYVPVQHVGDPARTVTDTAPSTASAAAGFSTDDRPPAVVPGSGDAAVAAAELRAAHTAGRTLADDAALPIPQDTANVRVGPELDPACVPLLPLIGVWRGEGEWSYPTLGTPRRFGQRLVISHDGRPFLRHEAVMWLLPESDDGAVDLDPERVVGDPDGAASTGEVEQAAREVGWWRPQPDGTVELVLAHAEGVVELFYGKAQTLTSWSLGTDAVVRTASAPTVTGATRLYGIVDGKLAYVEERATADHELQPHTSALLERTVG